MQSAQLHPNIRYIALQDEEGDLGLLIHHAGDTVYNVIEVHDQDHFAKVYDKMVEVATMEF